MSEKHKGNHKQKGECSTAKTNSSNPQTIQAIGLDCEGSAITAGPVKSIRINGEGKNG